MAGVVLETFTLSTKKLTILVFSLILGIIGFFLIGGLIAPAPFSSISFLPVLCIDKEYYSLNKKPLISRGSGTCDKVSDLNHPSIVGEKIEASDIVFSQWLPLPRYNTQLKMSRWFQTMHTVIYIYVLRDPENPFRNDKKPTIMLDTIIYARDATDSEDEWKEYVSAKVERSLDCSIGNEDKTGDAGDYSCVLLPFFELDSVYYDFYLINLRIPVHNETHSDIDIGRIREIEFVTFFQNGEFTKVWFSLKTVLFFLTLTALVWFGHRIVQLSRLANLLERILFALGIILSIMNFPLEWLTLWADLPFMALINDIRVVIFYAVAMIFWLIFIGEHLIDRTERNRLSAYWKPLTAICIGCKALLIFSIIERGVELSNPFSSIWTTFERTKMALSFIILTGMAACGYFFYLSYLTLTVLRSAKAKSAFLIDSHSCRLKLYSGCLCHLIFLMLSTLLCAALTVVYFIIIQVSQGAWKWGSEAIFIHNNSSYLIGVYGLWNIYTIVLMYLYAPSDKIISTTASSAQLPSESASAKDVQPHYICDPGQLSLLNS